MNGLLRSGNQSGIHEATVLPLHSKTLYMTGDALCEAGLLGNILAVDFVLSVSYLLHHLN